LVYQKLVIQFNNDSNCTFMTLNNSLHLALFDSTDTIPALKTGFNVSFIKRRENFISHKSVKTDYAGTASYCQLMEMI
jgi:hypothetical protein